MVPKPGIFSDNRIAWVSFMKWEMVVFRGDSDQFLEKQGFEFVSEQVKLVIRLPGKARPQIINLTHMTASELDEFQKCINFAVDEARPLCAESDRQAKEAWDAGDDSWARMYRPDVVFVIRGINSGNTGGGKLPATDDAQRVQPEHTESVSERPVSDNDDRTKPTGGLPLDNSPRFPF